MIRFRAFGVRFALPPLLLIAPVLAARLGARGGVGALFLALSAHELAHLFAAKLSRVEIAEIRLMPFGGSAIIENPYRLAPGQLIPTAAAGPAANLLLAVLLAALVQWRLILPGRAEELVRPNLALALFNLLPALPLDGGRILCALLQGPLGDRRAQSLALWLGRFFAGTLLLAFLLGGVEQGIWNVSLALAAIFLFASGRDETGALTIARAEALSDALDANSSPRPARIYQLDGQTPARRALSLLRPRERAWFVLTANGAPSSLLDGRSVVTHLARGGSPEAPLAQLPGFTLARAQ